MFAPEQGNMLGGNLVNISGPCYGPNTLVKCRFYDREVEGVVRDTNTAFCVQPRLFATGYVDIAVSLDGGPYYWKGQYYVGEWNDRQRAVLELFVSLFIGLKQLLQLRS